MKEHRSCCDSIDFEGTLSIGFPRNLWLFSSVHKKKLVQFMFFSTPLRRSHFIALRISSGAAGLSASGSPYIADGALAMLVHNKALVGRDMGDLLLAAVRPGDVDLIHPCRLSKPEIGS